MKINFKIIGFLFAAVIMFSACEEDERAYGTFDPATEVVASTIIISAPSLDVVVDPTTATTSFTIAVQLQGSLVNQDITIPFIVDSTNMVAAQYTIEGSGFVIPAGSNTGEITITLTKDEFFPGELFQLYYSLGTPTAGSLNDLGKAGSFSAFNPGLLGPWVGSYTGNAASLNVPGDWDEVWTVSTVLDPAAPLDNILIYGIAGAYLPLIATIDIDNSTITVESGQMIGNPYGYGDSYVYYATPPFVATMDDIVGTVDEDGTFVIPNMGLTTGPYWWDVFTVTFTPSSKSMGIQIPSTKKPHLYN